MFLFEGGFADISNKGTTWHYYVNDHLGSKRIVQDEKGKVEATYNYYPFGNMFEHWAELYAKSLQQPYKFNGKEYDSMYSLCMYDFEARMYDPLLGRWNAVDPLCEKYYSWSPYVFCLNNPIRNIDRDGKAVIKGITTALKLTKRAYHIYKKTGKLSANTLKKAGLSEIVDMAGDLYTLFDSKASILDKLKGGADLLLGTNLNNKGAKEVNTLIQNTESTFGKVKGSLSETKKALGKVKEILELTDSPTLPKMKSKFGSPARGTPLKGYRLDPAHTNRDIGTGEEYPHINYWDYTKGKRNKNGISGTIPITK